MTLAPAIMILSQLLASAVLAAPDIDLTPASVDQSIKERGAPAVVATLHENGAGAWKRIIRKIEDGEVGWIRLAPELKGGTDAGLTEDLQFALSVALTKRPDAVLAVIGEAFPAEIICATPYIEPSPQQAHRYLSKAIAAVSKVDRESISHSKAECLAELHKDASRN